MRYASFMLCPQRVLLGALVLGAVIVSLAAALGWRIVVRARLREANARMFALDAVRMWREIREARRLVAADHAERLQDADHGRGDG